MKARTAELAKHVLFLVIYLVLVPRPVAAQTMSARSTGTAASEGVELYYHTYGTSGGDPLLILNGGPGVSSEHFAALAARIGALGAGYHTILFDQRGTGRSTLNRVDSTTVTVRLMIEDIEVLRRHLGIEKWIVMGHSWGGMYAMTYATTYPDRVRGLILSSSGGPDLEWLSYVGANLQMRLGPERREAYLRTFDPDYIAADSARASRERIEAMAAAYVYDPENIPFVVESLSRPGANFPAVRTLVYSDLQRIRYDLKDVLAGLAAPAIIIHGRQDILGEEAPLRTHAALPNSELVWLNLCSHYGWLDRPEAYFGAVAGFLTGIQADAH